MILSSNKSRQTKSQRCPEANIANCGVVPAKTNRLMSVKSKSGAFDLMNLVLLLENQYVIITMCLLLGVTSMKINQNPCIYLSSSFIVNIGKYVRICERMKQPERLGFP